MYNGKHRNRTCRRCGRFLPSLRSQALGIGPTCLRYERQALAAEFKEPQRDWVTGALRSHATRRVKPGVYQVKSGKNRYLTSKGACTCASGRYRPWYGSCKHQLLIRQLEVKSSG